MDRRGDSAPRAGIRHAAEKGNSYPADLHPEAFIVFFTLWALYLLEKNRDRWFPFYDTFFYG
jgi:hypothetical protein